MSTDPLTGLWRGVRCRAILPQPRFKFLSRRNGSTLPRYTAHSYSACRTTFRLPVAFFYSFLRPERHNVLVTTLNTLSYLLVVLCAAPLTWYCTKLTRQYAMSSGMLDVPTGRSSHRLPTPRGAGLAIVVVSILGIVAGAVAGWLPPAYAWTVGLGGALVAFVGWMDDRRGLSPFVRLVAHASASAWALWWLGGFRLLRMESSGWLMISVGMALSFLVITWAISSYNFMDGIDALAGAEAVWVGLIGGALALRSGHHDIAFVSLLLAAASAGFLHWNLPPAKVFLGDVGSGFLGYAFVTLALLSDREGALPAHGWLILLGVFVFDSTTTLLRRMIRGEAWNATHRESAYQRAALRFARHAPVTIVVLLLNVILSGLTIIGVIHPTRWVEIGAVAFFMLVAVYVAVDRFAPIARATPST